MRTNLFQEHARELAKMPDEWIVYSFKAIPNSDGTLEFKGAIAPIYSRGKSKGLPNWKMSDKNSERTVYIKESEHDLWLAKWEKETGQCHECVGTGDVFQSWELGKGVIYKKCSVCVGTGAARFKQE
jgi:hypothetical protein